MIPQSLSHIRHEKSKPSRKYGCLMAVLPYGITNQILKWTRGNVDHRHLSEEGVEDKVHVTVKYGFEDEGVIDQIEDALRPFRPFVIRLKTLSLFRGTEDGDVLKVDVESSVLREINRCVSNSFACHDKYPVYKPHLTLAYLKPSFSSAYLAAKPPFVNTAVLVTRLEYSTADREKIVIDLSSGEKALSWLSTTAGGALVKPPGQGKVVSPLVRPSPFLKEILNAGTKSFPNSHTKEADQATNKPLDTPYRGPGGRCMVRRRFGDRLRVVPAPATACGKVEEGKPDYKPPPRAKKEKPQVQREVKVKPTVEQVEQGIAQFMKEGSDTPEARATLLSAIASLTVKQIHDLKRRSAGVLKASGNKETLVNKLVDRIVAKVKPVTQETGPKTETQKVVEEVNKPEPSAADRVKDALGRMLQQANLDPEGDAFDAALTAYTRILEDVTLNPDDPERASDGLREFQEVLSEVRKDSRQREMEQEDRERKIQQEEETRRREEEDRQRAEQEEVRKDITPESQPEAFLDAQGGPKQETDKGPQVSKEGNPEEQYFGEESTPERWKEHPSIKALGDKFKLGKADDPKVRENVEQLSKVPARLMKMLASHLGLEGVSVGEGAFTDFETGRPFKGVRPRGWPEGKTWDDVPGAYYSVKKHVVIGTRGNHGSESLALHEFGHAVGHLMGWDTNDEWSQIHKEVFNDLSPYFQQEGEAGPQEMLAETFAATLMDRNEAVRNFGERAVKWMEAKIRDYQDPVGKEPHKEDQLQEASSSTGVENQPQQSSAKTESGYGQSGPHPLSGKDREQQVIDVQKMAWEAYDNVNRDPLGIVKAGSPEGTDMDAFTNDLIQMTAQHTLDKGVPPSVQTAYETLGEKYGLSKYDFLRALASIDANGGADRESAMFALGGGGAILQAMEHGYDPELVPINRTGAAHQIRFIRGKADTMEDLKRLARTGDAKKEENQSQQQPQQPQQSQSKVPGGLQLPDVGKSPFEKPQNNPTREQVPKAQSRPKTPRTGSRELDAKLSRERDPARAAVALIQNVREAFEASSVRRDVKPEELMGHYLDRLTDDQARQALISISGPAGRIAARQSNPKERLRRQFQTKWEILSRAEGISGRKG